MTRPPVEKCPEDTWSSSSSNVVTITDQEREGSGRFLQTEMCPATNFSDPPQLGGNHGGQELLTNLGDGKPLTQDQEAPQEESLLEHDSVMTESLTLPCMEVSLDVTSDMKSCGCSATDEEDIGSVGSCSAKDLLHEAAKEPLESQKAKDCKPFPHELHFGIHNRTLEEGVSEKVPENSRSVDKISPEDREATTKLSQITHPLQKDTRKHLEACLSGISDKQGSEVNHNSQRHHMFHKEHKVESPMFIMPLVPVCRQTCLQNKSEYGQEFGRRPSSEKRDLPVPASELSLYPCNTAMLGHEAKMPPLGKEPEDLTSEAIRAPRDKKQKNLTSSLTNKPSADESLHSLKPHCRKRHTNSVASISSKHCPEGNKQMAQLSTSKTPMLPNSKHIASQGVAPCLVSRTKAEKPTPPTGTKTEKSPKSTERDKTKSVEASIRQGMDNVVVKLKGGADTAKGTSTPAVKPAENSLDVIKAIMSVEPPARAHSKKKKYKSQNAKGKIELGQYFGKGDSQNSPEGKADASDLRKKVIKNKLPSSVANLGSDRSPKQSSNTITSPVPLESCSQLPTRITAGCSNKLAEHLVNLKCVAKDSRFQKHTEASVQGEDVRHPKKLYSELVKQKPPTLHRAPKLLQNIQAKKTPDDPGSICLWTCFCKASADCSVQWAKEGLVLSEERMSVSEDSQVSYTIANVSSKDLGWYQCCLSCCHGNVSSEFHLTSDVLNELIPSHHHIVEVSGTVGEDIKCSPLLFKEDFLNEQFFGEDLPARILTEDVHFGEGMYRKAFRTKLLAGMMPFFGEGHPCVLKVHSSIGCGTKNNEELVQKNYNLAAEECHVQNTAREYIRAYTEAAQSAQAFGEVPEIIPIYLVHRPNNDIPYATLEEELLGDFVKYSVKDGKEINVMRRDSEAGQKCCAFQHWVFNKTGGNLLVTDMQGVGMKLTDVGIATCKKGYNGFRGNCATSFIDQFNALHQCNRFCELLGLNNLQASQQKPKRPGPAAKPKPQPMSKKKTSTPSLKSKT